MGESHRHAVPLLPIVRFAFAQELKNSRSLGALQIEKLGKVCSALPETFEVDLSVPDMFVCGK